MDQYSPKKTLSTSTQESFEALDPHDPELCKYAKNMFEKTGLYLKGELSAVLEDYKLLDNMNAATASRYQQVDASIARLNTANSQINQQMVELLPLMKEIDEIECTVEKLEQAAYRLDAYTTKLENQFKTVFPKQK
ncbi:biogenesis of lysosome-related organelles complex 1 subunit 2 [Culicoides brevitarsis]|uniref:biogenesis of lysosome-related organelles complex 1 subunit 2 n=1 Tax=Culicoides brevitarsis TaxID=469753 RepID=UPI00307B4FA4